MPNILLYLLIRKQGRLFSYPRDRPLLSLLLHFYHCSTTLLLLFNGAADVGGTISISYGQYYTRSSALRYSAASGDLAASLLGASGFTINFATTTYLCYSTTSLVIISRITPPILDRTTTQVTHLESVLMPG